MADPVVLANAVMMLLGQDDDPPPSATMDDIEGNPEYINWVNRTALRAIQPISDWPVVIFEGALGKFIESTLSLKNRENTLDLTGLTQISEDEQNGAEVRIFKEIKEMEMLLSSNDHYVLGPSSGTGYLFLLSPHITRTGEQMIAVALRGG